MKKNKITFSVVIPSYATYRDVVERTIKSVLLQNREPEEIIIIDDNGGNNFTKISKEIENKHYKNVRFIYNSKNKGANYSRNQGIICAKGDYIAFLDADDEWNIDYLKEVENCIIKENAQFISVNHQIVHETTVMPPRFNAGDRINGPLMKRQLYKDCVGPTSVVVVRRLLLISAGLFDESLPARQDYDMWVRIGELSPINHVYRPLVKIYRDGHVSISSSYKRNVEGTKIVLNKILHKYNLTEQEKKAISASHYTHMAICCILGNDYKEARSYLKHVLKCQFTIKELLYYWGCHCPFAFKIAKKIRRRLKYKSRK